MAKAATAYVEIVPDVSDFADKLKADLERITAKKFEVEVKPDLSGFSQDVRDTLANNRQDLQIPIEPDFEGLSAKIRAGLAAQDLPKIKLKVEIDQNQAALLEQTILRSLGGGGGGNNRLDETAGKMAKGFMGSLTSNLQKNADRMSDGVVGFLFNPLVLPFTLAAGALAAVFVTAFVGGLLAGFTGLGVAALATMVLKGEPELAAAGSRLSKTFTESFKEAAQPALGGILSLVDMVTKEIGNSAGMMKGLFGDIAGPLVALGRSVARAIHSITLGLTLNTEGITAGIVGIGAIIESVGSAIQGVFMRIAHDPDNLRQSLEDLGLVLRQIIATVGWLLETGIKFENFARSMVRNLMDINKAGWDLTAHGSLQGFHKLVDDWTGKTDKLRKATQATTEANRAFIDGITARARTSNPTATLEQIDTAINKVKGSFKAGSLTADQFAAEVSITLKGMALAMEATNWQKFADDAAGGFKSVDESVQATRKEVDGLIEALDLLNGRFMSKESARIAFKKTLRDMADAVKAGKIGFNENTEAGLNNKTMMMKATEQVAEFVKRSLENGDSLKQVASNVNGLSASLLAQGGKLAGNKAAALAYITQLEATPKQIFTALALQGVPGAQEALDELTKDKTVNIKPVVAPDAFKGIFTDRDPELKNAGAQAGSKAAEGIGAAMAAKLTASDPAMQKAGLQAAKSFATGVTAGKQNVTGASSTLMQQLSDGLGKTFSVAYDAGTMAAYGLVSGLHSQSGYVYTAVNSWVQTNVNKAIADALKTKSPSKVTYGYGQMAAVGLAEGIDDKAHTVRNSATNLYKQLGRPPTMAGAVETNGVTPTINARIFVGDRELTDIVKSEVSVADQRQARALYYGRRV
jgi:hypothetical protein